MRLVTFHSGAALPRRRRPLSALLRQYLKTLTLEHSPFAGHARFPHAHKCHRHQSTSGSSCVSPLQTWSSNGTRTLILFNTSTLYIYSFTSLWYLFLVNTLYSCSSRRPLPFDKSLFSLTLSPNYSHLMWLRWITLREACMVVLRRTTKVVRLFFYIT